MRNLQQGFTLIELVAVIVILGILAAVAAPKFIDVSNDAYVAKIHAAEGSLKSANALLNSKAIIHNLDLGDAVMTFDGIPVNMTNGYIDATVNDVAAVLDIEYTKITNLTERFSSDYGIHVATISNDKTEVSILAKPHTTATLSCGFKYSFNMSIPSKPVYTAELDCD